MLALLKGPATDRAIWQLPPARPGQLATATTNHPKTLLLGGKTPGRLAPDFCGFQQKLGPWGVASWSLCEHTQLQGGNLDYAHNPLCVAQVGSELSLV